MENHEHFLAIALQEAKKAEKKLEVPVGAVLVCNGEIVARAHNLREKKQSVLAHAELLALQKTHRLQRQWRLEGCSIYVTLEPCVMCAAALQQARVNKVYFGAWDPKGGFFSLGYSLPNLQYEFIENSACSRILTDFFRSIRRQRQ